MSAYLNTAAFYNGSARFCAHRKVSQGGSGLDAGIANAALQQGDDSRDQPLAHHRFLHIHVASRYIPNDSESIRLRLYSKRRKTGTKNYIKKNTKRKSKGRAQNLRVEMSMYKEGKKERKKKSGRKKEKAREEERRKNEDE